MRNSWIWSGATVLALLVAAAQGQTTRSDADAPALGRADVHGRTVNKYGVALAPERTPGAIRIATYNMLNFFDQVNDPDLEGEFDDLPMATSEARCQELARAILAIDADIVALQEVESLEALTWFRDTFLADAGYDHIASEDVFYFRGVECSLLSRFEITKTQTWPHVSLNTVERDGPGWTPVPEEHQRGLTYRRSPLMVEIQVDEDYALTLFVVHHKAGRDRWYREAEALKTAEIIADLEATDPPRNVIVLGDFNAAPWDKSMRVYLEDGFIDTLSHRIIPRWRNPTETQIAEKRLYTTHESDRVLDYILLNSAAHREFVVGSAFVFGTLTPPDDYDFRKDPKPAGYASDHYPVVIDLIPEDRK